MRTSDHDGNHIEHKGYREILFTIVNNLYAMWGMIKHELSDTDYTTLGIESID